MCLVHQPVLPHHFPAICWAPPYHRAFAPAASSTWFHSNSTPPERLSQVPQVQAWYSIERLHRVCHYLPVCMYLVACCLSPLLYCQAPEVRDLCLFVYGCIPSLGQRLAHSRCCV